MKSMDEIVEYALSNGFSEKSRIFNVTHSDLDGIVSTINIFNYVDDPQDVFYVQKIYDNINELFTEILFKDNCSFKKIDFVLATDISVDEGIIEECEKRDIKLIVLDHHETAYHLNKYTNCYVEEDKAHSGAEVTLEFLKLCGMTTKKLDKLNKVATQFDLFLFKTPELRKYKIGGMDVSLAEMFNTLYFKTPYVKDSFIKRWEDGWGKGFNEKEVELIKSEYESAKSHILKVDNSKLKVQLEDNKLLILAYDYIVHTGNYYLDEKDYDLILFFNTDKCKLSARVSDTSPINIGKILETINKKFDYLSNGGGHAKAGGCNLTTCDRLDEVVCNIVKLSEFYEQKV
jgi:oligoribonuclease NrnB/cAMP/cGMP phosphodiesterase (DHH superfamily)